MRSRITLLIVTVVLYAVPSTVLAHEGHTTETSSGPEPLVLALLASSVMLVGAGIYLDSRDDATDRYAMLGVGLGIAGLVLTTLLYLL